ncbi:indole-3-butyric acid response 5 [Striga asiatica]|uniref:Indole-3-butyric acid response 5 n=1 Tax=Striga asiatica TaxID=4170 RepID=A0A5A7Q1L7_STRAF|nr:indole-3-butyric acid response 5 [Striga asiatica]
MATFSFSFTRLTSGKILNTTLIAKTSHLLFCNPVKAQQVPHCLNGPGRSPVAKGSFALPVSGVEALKAVNLPNIICYRLADGRHFQYRVIGLFPGLRFQRKSVRCPPETDKSKNDY